MSDSPVQKVVTRFAPSPTGFMHVGSLRTALFAWLFARKHKGIFILRIEDTDKEREVEGSIPHIIESLTWLDLKWQEGVEVGGPHAPYIQSERLDLYKKYAEILIEKGHAYPDPYTEEEVEAFRTSAEEEKRPFLFRDHRPAHTGAWDKKRPLRFRVPAIKRYTWHDAVRGELSAGEEALDDFILIKGDGYPTYNFAHIVDDIQMEVTHVMRGEEFISSTPKFLSLYEALGVVPPQFATLPVILGPDGKKKLSKRDGAKDILDYRAEGYVPEAMRNYLAFLGWNPGDEREVMDTDALAEAFELSRIQKSGSAFDEVKLRWFNKEHLRSFTPATYASRLRSFMNDREKTVPVYLDKIVPLLQERAETLGEALALIESGEFSFFDEEISYEPDLLLNKGKIDQETAHKHLAALATIVEKSASDPWTADLIKECIFPYAEAEGRGVVLWPLRIALSGRERSPDPFTIASLIGREKALKRIAAAAEKLYS